LHFVGLTSVLDVPRLIVVLGSDGQRLLMEVPDLGSSSIWSLDDKVSVVDQVNVPVVWKLRHNVEWSFDVETEFFVQFSLSWFALPFVSIDDIPLLVDLAVLWSGFDVSVFSINVSLNMDDLTFLVGDKSILVSEHLPPS